MSWVCSLRTQNIHLNYICYHRLLKRNGNHKLSSTSKQRREHWQMCLSSLGRQVGHPCIKGCLLMGNSDCPKMSIVDIDISCTQAHRQACICIHLTYIHIHIHTHTRERETVVATMRTETADACSLLKRHSSSHILPSARLLIQEGQQSSQPFCDSVCPL